LLVHVRSVEEVVVVADADIVCIIIDFDFVFGVFGNFRGIFPWEEIVLAEVESLFIVIRG